MPISAPQFYENNPLPSNNAAQLLREALAGEPLVGIPALDSKWENGLVVCQFMHIGPSGHTEQPHPYSKRYIAINIPLLELPKPNVFNDLKNAPSLVVAKGELTFALDLSKKVYSLFVPTNETAKSITQLRETLSRVLTILFPSEQAEPLQTLAPPTRKASNAPGKHHH